MTAPPGFECGDVISVFNYEFDDGSVADSKYFVVMGYHLEQVLGFLTTSKEKGGRTRTEGCHPEYGKYPSNYYIKLKNSPFVGGTWVILNAEMKDHKLFLNKLREGGAVRVFTLPEQHISALKNCFKKSPDWSPFYADSICGGK